jgi:hypothetical protein
MTVVLSAAPTQRLSGTVAHIANIGEDIWGQKQ